jgi:hypothetical protein
MQVNCSIVKGQKLKLQLVPKQHKGNKKLDRLVNKNIVGYKKD